MSASFIGADELCRKATTDVALARECPPFSGTRTCLVPAHSLRAKTDNTIGPFAWPLSKPSGGLEPSTPPDHGGLEAVLAGTPGHQVDTFFL